jgi:hypothetical protein
MRIRLVEGNANILDSKFNLLDRRVSRKSSTRSIRCLRLEKTEKSSGLLTSLGMTDLRNQQLRL